MLRSVKVLFVVAALVSSILVGCSDDDCATCSTETMAFASGYIALDSLTEVYDLSVIGRGADFPVIDSVRVGDSLLPDNDIDIRNSDWPPLQTWEIDFQESPASGSPMYHSGDVATVHIWGEDRHSSASVTILNSSADSARITQPVAETYIATDESATVYWKRVAHAEHYVIMLELQIASKLAPENQYQYHCTSDTMYTFQGSTLDASAYRCIVYVTPYNGPAPGTTNGNFTGDFCEGRLISAASYDWVYIYVGYVGLSEQTATADAQEAGSKCGFTSQEIIERFLSRR